MLLRAIIRSLRHLYGSDEMAVGVTASTGMAAVNIGGMTLHSFTGFPSDIGHFTSAKLAKRIARDASTKERWMRLRVLIIDEGEFIPLHPRVFILMSTTSIYDRGIHLRQAGRGGTTLWPYERLSLRWNSGFPVHYEYLFSLS